MSDLKFAAELSDKGFLKGLQNIERSSEQSSRAVRNMFRFELLRAGTQQAVRFVGRSLDRLAQSDEGVAALQAKLQAVFRPLTDPAILDALDALDEMAGGIASFAGTLNTYRDAIASGWGQLLKSITGGPNEAVDLNQSLAEQRRLRAESTAQNKELRRIKAAEDAARPGMRSLGRRQNEEYERLAFAGTDRAERTAAENKYRETLEQIEAVQKTLNAGSRDELELQAKKQGAYNVYLLTIADLDRKQQEAADARYAEQVQAAAEAAAEAEQQAAEAAAARAKSLRNYTDELAAGELAAAIERGGSSKYTDMMKTQLEYAKARRQVEEDTAISEQERADLLERMTRQEEDMLGLIYKRSDAGAGRYRTFGGGLTDLTGTTMGQIFNPPVGAAVGSASSVPNQQLAEQRKATKLLEAIASKPAGGPATFN